MILAIIFAQVWGVVQLIALTSMARTVRVRTVFAAMAVGFYAIGPVTAFIQLSWIHLAAPLIGMPPAALQGIASYSVDPFIEEAMKLLPLAILMLIPAIRRQWSVSDCVLIGAATGSGFGLTEHLFRYAANPGAAEGVSGGWVLSIGNFNVLVPGIFRTLTSWIPNGTFFHSDPIIINWHLAWSAIGGLAVGLIVRKPVKRAWLIASGLFLFIGLDHAAGNARNIQDTWLALLAAPLQFLTICLGLLVLAAIVAAWWLDQPSQRLGMALGPLLAAEQSSSSQRSGTLAAAFSRLPWSLPWVVGFDRARRAYQAAHAASPDGHDDLREAVVAHRDAVDLKLKQPLAPALLPSWLTSGNLRNEIRSALRRPPVIIWLVLIAPSVLFLIVGGWPQTAGLQKVLTGPFVWPLVLLITVANQSRLAWRVIVGVRGLPATARLPVGDDAAMLGLQLACGVGAISLGGFTLLRVLSGVSAGQTLLSHAHAADAADRVTPGSGSAVAGSAGAFDPPPASPDLPEGPADAAAAAAAAGAAAANDGAAGDGAADDGTPGDSADGPAGNDVSSSEAAAEKAANEAAAANAGTAASEAAAAQAAAAAAESAAREEAAGEASTGGAFDPPPPSLELPHTAVDAASDASAPATEGAAAGEYEANRAAAAADDAAQAAADDAASAKPQPAPAPPQPTPQDQADDAVARSEQADDDAVAAQKARNDARDALDHAEIKQRTDDPGYDPDVAAARERLNEARAASVKADAAAVDGDDPWDPNAPNKSAADAFGRGVKDAQQAEADAQSALADRQAADVASAKAAADQAQSALDAANAKAAAANQNVATSQANADAAAAKAASDAARAANPAQAAADDAAKALAAAQASENKAFFGNDAKAYHDARAALDAARAKADAAQAAADAAKNDGSGGSIAAHKKP